MNRHSKCNAIQYDYVIFMMIIVKIHLDFVRFCHIECKAQKGAKKTSETHKMNHHPLYWLFACRKVVNHLVEIGHFVHLRPFSTRAKSAALASSKYLNSQSAIKKELSAQADCATNFLQPIKLQERSSFF